MRPKGHFIRYLPEEMYSPRTPKLFETKKIISQTMLSRIRLVATLDEEGYYVEQSLLCVVPHGIFTEKQVPIDVNLAFVLAAMNSRLQSFFYGAYVIDYSLGGGLIHATPGSQAKLLVPKAPDEEVHRIVALVRQLFDVKKRLGGVHNPGDRELLERRAEAIDRRIDASMYSFYNLNDNEIRVIENATTI